MIQDVLPSRLDLGEPIDARGDVAIVAGLGLQLDADRQRARRSRRRSRAPRRARTAAVALRRASAPAPRRRARTTRSPAAVMPALAIDPAEQRRRREAQPRRPRGRLERRNASSILPARCKRQPALVLFVGSLERRSARRLRPQLREDAVEVAAPACSGAVRQRRLRLLDVVEHDAQIDFDALCPRPGDRAAIRARPGGSRGRRRCGSARTDRVPSSSAPASRPGRERRIVEPCRRGRAGSRGRPGRRRRTDRNGRRRLEGRQLVAPQRQVGAHERRLTAQSLGDDGIGIRLAHAAPARGGSARCSRAPTARARPDPRR